MVGLAQVVLQPSLDYGEGRLEAGLNNIRAGPIMQPEKLTAREFRLVRSVVIRSFSVISLSTEAGSEGGCSIHTIDPDKPLPSSPLFSMFLRTNITPTSSCFHDYSVGHPSCSPLCNGDDRVCLRARCATTLTECKLQATCLYSYCRTERRAKYQLLS